MEAILNQSLFHPHCLTSVIGKLTLLSWTSQIQFVLERYFQHFLDVNGIVSYLDASNKFKTFTVLWSTIYCGMVVGLELFLMIDYSEINSIMLQEFYWFRVWYIQPS